MLYFIAITSYNQRDFHPRITNMPLSLFAHERVNPQHFYRFISSNKITSAVLSRASYKRVLHKIANGTKVVLLVILFLNITNCSFFISSTTEKLANNLSAAILEQDDPETVKYGAPAYLIMIDGLITDDPTNENLLLSGAKLYTSYASAFIEDPDRAKRLANKAWGFAQRAICLKIPPSCKIHQQTHDKYNAFLLTITKEDIDLLYIYGTSWVSYIQANKDDWNAVADLPKVTATLKHVEKLDDTHDNGGVHLYLGVLASLLPPALGGKPDEVKFHFEHAIELSKGENLMIKVFYAEKYARMIFNRKLHDEILQSVVKSEPDKPGLTLMNTLAQDRAKELLKSADEYF